MATQVELTAFSPAKINLYLRIFGKRADGYHDLETVMMPLDFGDEIVCQRRRAGLTLECDDPRLPTDESNLAMRAALALKERCEVTSGARMVLKKRTPLAAGLGGGSSNAATVLRTLNQLWKLNAPESLLHELAAGLGSDINFFLRGGPCLCRGRGELTEPLASALTTTVLMVNPGFGIATKWAYASWAQAASKLTVAPPAVTVLARALAGNDLAGVARGLFNSLEAPSVGKFPVLQVLKETLIEHGAAGAMMSGSGATVFGLFADDARATECGQWIRQEFGPSMWTQVAHFGHGSQP